MQKTFLRLAAILGALAVILGAFGSHILRKALDPETFSAFQTAVYYHIFHVIALLVVGMLYKRYPNKWMLWAGRLFIFGILLFSGSLYVLTANAATNGGGLSEFGLVTPIGGGCLIAGWICVFFGIPLKSTS
jgi:uncharacterized membrane protein YgdD (TMEM256/DUF423 family)